MNESPWAGKTIDSKGNIIDKPSGVSRWANPRIRPCQHKECEDAAEILSAGCPGMPRAHNCCCWHKDEI